MERYRAERTSEILDLNRAAACKARLTTIEMILRRKSNDELADVGCRFLIPLVAS